MTQTTLHVANGTCCPERADWINNHCYHCGRPMSDECDCMAEVAEVVVYTIVDIDTWEQYGTEHDSRESADEQKLLLEAEYGAITFNIQVWRL